MSIFVNVKIVHWTFWLIKKSTSYKLILKALWNERQSFWEPQMYDTWRRTGREIYLRIITCSSQKEHWRLYSLDLSIYRWRNWRLGTCIIMIIFNMVHSCSHWGLDPRSFLFSGGTFFLVPHSSQVYVCAKQEEAVISCYSCRVTVLREYSKTTVGRDLESPTSSSQFLENAILLLCSSLHLPPIHHFAYSLDSINLILWRLGRGVRRKWMERGGVEFGPRGRRWKCKHV